MAQERTLSIIKPDAVSNNVVGDIVSRFENAGLKVIAMRMERLSQERAKVKCLSSKSIKIFS